MTHLSYRTLALKGCLILLFSFAYLPATTIAQTSPSIDVSSELDAETTDRFTESNAFRIITNRDNSVNLVVSMGGIAIQFSDEFLNNLEEEIKNSDENTSEASALADVIRSMVGSGVRTILDHAILIPYYEINSVSYSDGRIVITDVNGEEIFNDLEINDKQVMEDFSGRDARRFVAEAEKRLI